MRKEILKGENLSLVTTKDSDFEFLYNALFSKQEIMKYLYNKALSQEEFKELFKKEFNFNSTFGFSPIMIESKIIGVGGIFEFSYKDFNGYEFGYILIKEFWGKGYATKIAKLQKEFIENCLKAKVFATAHPKNLASLKVLKKCGLQAIAQDRLKRGERVIYAKF